MKLKVNDITLNVLVEGDDKAPPVLLLHGFPDSSKLWTGQVPTSVSLFLLSPSSKYSTSCLGELHTVSSC